MLCLKMRIPGEELGNSLTSTEIPFTYGNYATPPRVSYKKAHEVARTFLNKEAVYQKDHYDAKHCQTSMDPEVVCSISPRSGTKELIQNSPYIGPHVIVEKYNKRDF